MTDNTATTAPSADQPKPADHSDTARVVSGFSRPPATGHRSAGPRPGHADETEISAAGIALDAHPGIHRGHPPARPSPAPPCGPTYSPSANAPNCSTAGSGNCRSGCPNARRNGWQESGLGVAPDIGNLNQTISHLGQQVTDLRLQARSCMETRPTPAGRSWMPVPLSSMVMVSTSSWRAR